MINKLRFKFISITMISVLAVLLLIDISINTVNIYHENRFLDSITEKIIQNGGRYRQPKNRSSENRSSENSTSKNKGNYSNFESNSALPISFITIFLTSDYKISDYHLRSLSLESENEIDLITETILKRGKNTVWFKDYRCRIGKYGDKYLIIALDASFTKRTILSIFTITVIVSLTAFILVFIAVVLLSKRAILPLAKSYEKQKQFITDTSHELKTPLTVISANSEILRLTYGENEWCDGIERQSNSMLMLINQMIQMSKLDEEKPQFELSKFNISEALYDTVMSFSSLSASNKLSLNVNSGDDIIFIGDESCIRQVFSILTDNAIKYCDKGGNIDISIKKTVKSFGHEKITISFKNTFSDVESIDTEKIFERFYMEDKSRSSSKSYGLGLSIAKSIIKNHNGTILARKIPGKIEFFITLPY